MKKIILSLLMFACFYANSQTTCQTAQPFCAGGTSGLTFPASTNQPNALPNNYNCLGTSPNAAWYYLQVATSGSIILHISGTANQDVDFICWGPFSSLSTVCNYSLSNVIDCNYSTSPTETCHIQNGVAGQYYMVLITNFSNQVQNITFDQIAGNGTTNCGLLANSSAICAGSAATITANNASNLANPSFSLNPGGLTSSNGVFIVTPVTTTNYTVYVTGVNNQSVVVTQTATSTVSINPQPLSNPTTTQTSCTSTVNAFNLGLIFNGPVPNYTVSWSSIPNGVTSPTQTAGTGGIGAGQYNATITAAGGCSVVTNFNINPIPEPSIFNLVPGGTSFSITCANPTVVISANPASYNYTWTNGSSAPQNGSTAYFTSANLGNWTATGVNPTSGCSSTQTFVVVQNITTPSSTVNPLGQTITCNLASVITVTGTGTPTTNITHFWVSPSGGTLTANTPTSVFVPGGPGIYSHYIVDNTNGCSSRIDFTVTSNDNFPTYSVSSTSNFTIGCSTTSITTINIVNGQTTPPGGALSYTVLSPTYVGPTYTTGGSTSYTANISGQYTVIAHDNFNGCETIDQISIISNTAVPTITATAVNPILTCDIPSTILKGTSGTPNVAFSWAFPGIPGQTPNDTLTVHTNTASPNNTVIATYTLSVTDNINLCVSKQTLTILQNTSRPTASITGGNSITCSTPTINLTNASLSHVPAAFFPSLPVIGFIWDGPSPQQEGQVSSTYIAFTPGTYTMTAKDLNNGCTAVATKTIADNRIYPIVNTPNTPGPFVLDCDALGVPIFPTVTGTTTGFTYSWVAIPTASFSSYITATTTVNQPGIYSIFVTNPTNGCISSGRVQVINGSLNGDFNPSTTSGFAPLAVSFQNLSASTSTISPTASITSVWSFGNGGSQITTSANIVPTVTYANPGTYTVTLFVNKGSCRDTVSKVITIELPSKLEIPNVFTPNGDGSNDVFFLKVANVSEINALIFDRWGNKVFETTSTTGNIDWDGKTEGGKDATAGVYFYVIKATGKDGKSYDQKGNISLFR